jgi:hypothetical protein
MDLTHSLQEPAVGTNIIDAFLVTLSLEISGFKKGEREIGDATKRLREGNKVAFTEMEQRGKSAGEAFKGVRNEVIGLGLAFMGASTITGLISNMMTGAATADRLGRTMGMTTEKVWAWRMAMKTINHSGGVADADAALSSIQKAKMGWRMGGDSGNNLAFSRLSVSGHDLETKDPGEILKKIATMQPKMDPQVYASLLSQIGMPASTIAFLQEGKGSVDALIAKFEKDADGQAKLAKETEDLQGSMVELESTITGMLVPVLKDLVHGVRQILSLFGYGDPDQDNNLPPVTGKAGHGGPDLPKYSAAQVHSIAGKPVSAETLSQINAARGGAPRVFAQKQGPAGDDNIIQFFMSKGRTHEQAVGMRGAIEGEGGLRQPLGGGYKGRAIGIGQLLGPRRAEFLRRYHGDMSLKNQLEFMWWELLGGDPGKGGEHVLKATSSLAVMSAMITKFYRPKDGFQTNRDLAAGAAYIRAHHHRAAAATHVTHTTHNTYHIKSTDPRGAAREVGALQRRSAVSQADRGVAP